MWEPRVTCDLKFKLAKLKLNAIFRTSAAPVTLQYWTDTLGQWWLNWPALNTPSSQFCQAELLWIFPWKIRRRQSTDNSPTSFLLRDPEWIMPKGWLMSDIPVPKRAAFICWAFTVLWASRHYLTKSTQLMRFVNWGPAQRVYISKLMSMQRNCLAQRDLTGAFLLPKMMSRDICGCHDWGRSSWPRRIPPRVAQPPMSGLGRESSPDPTTLSRSKNWLLGSYLFFFFNKTQIYRHRYNI